jgi:hypothetical protein
MSELAREEAQHLLKGIRTKRGFVTVAHTYNEEQKELAEVVKVLTEEAKKSNSKLLAQ